MLTKNRSCLIICVLFFLCFSISLNLSEGADSITANQSLSVNQTIISAGETFELGFFRPGKSSRYYVGTWYKNVSQRTIVWVANRENPISDVNSAELKILDGNLVLIEKAHVRVWSTNINSTTSNSVVATLGDDGNLVLRDGSEPRTSEGFWQSFDNPADTCMPGGKIAYDKRTKTKQLFISWRNSEDPAPGLFSLELDPNGRQIIIRWNRNEQYWASGAWNGHIFSLVPEMRLNYIYNYSYEDKENESYFTYSFYDPSFISRFVMDVSGQIKQFSWSENMKEWKLFWSQPRQQCEVYAYCGAYGSCNQNSLPFCSCLPGFKEKLENDWNLKDYSGGCEREINLLQCENGSTSTGTKDKFLPNPQVRLPKNSQSMMAGSAGECESVCLNNCSCTAYSYDGNCMVWNGEIMNLQQLSENDGSGRTIYIRLAASAPQFSSNKKNKGVVMGAVVGSVAVVMVLLAFVGVMIWRHRRRRVGAKKAVEGSMVAFGFGMMLFEFISGRRNSEQSEDGMVKFFPSFAASVIAEGGDILGLLDPALDRHVDAEEVSKICKVASWCIQDEENIRPSMGHVVQILEGILDVNLPPIPRSLKLFVESQEQIVFFTDSSSGQSSQTLCGLPLNPREPHQQISA
ncbi:unnamed protein product [Fraxinus pennsylvanica]|uniref:Uncharacterized protein n=1 Tax=Fraxinus pennsylvanica TaxID=56036 RepID=A0AAD1YYU1_9LAMI|nr:unnamed protein product [Fraxinus pennsylvanica]